MTTATLTGIVVYPLKSAAGVAVSRARVERQGLALDRRWMLVDEEGMFLSQRSEPRLALIRIEIGTDRLTVSAPGMPALELDLDPARDDTLPVHLWGDDVAATRIGADEDGWFRAFLGRRVRLVHVPDEHLRQVDPEFARQGDLVGFADGYPFLLASESSLAALNERLDEPLPMNRFRPNLIVRGAEPWAEDGWDRIRMGDIVFHVVKPCARCSITTVDQDTGARGKEPLRTLARFRRVGNKVMFAQNLVHDATGTIEVGSRVEIWPREAPEEGPPVLRREEGAEGRP